MRKDEIAEASKNSVLKEVFDKYSEDTITDEQLCRILEPVLIMIREGRFDRNRKYRISQIFIPLILLWVVNTFSDNLLRQY